MNEARIVETIAKNLVDHPEEVVVTEEERDDALIIRLKVAPSDKGKVIGKGGQTANDMRNLLTAASLGRKKKLVIDIN